ncbi:hypothetical protein DEJ28_14175 [Curtobacterium sp. MCPF17_002]|uniref:PIN-like domain-containing protein n=1 Tax=Curtobacterium sp. MCPF17_002 TaxID=2175645 RepID=UPI000DAA00F2|nr:hypothetical protein [Curtobacterium sp. MCPF17_002]WIB76789.1 hypothetical protein DEJ28_14175 [Curtobacterium sp. MCPF17_002]
MRPHLFLDENVSHVYAKSLRPLMKTATLSSAVEEHLTGVPDIELFAELSVRKFDGIITHDRNQLQIPEELEALRESGLHWIGLSRPEGRALEVHGQVLSTLMFVVPTLVASWPDVPHRHHITLVSTRHVPRRVSAPL